MNERRMTLTLDNVQIRDTVPGMTATGWMQVSDELSEETMKVLMKLQTSLCDPWLAPRHQWLVKNDGTVYAYFDNVRVEMLWTEYDKSAAIAEKGVKLLERIMDIILATNGSASWAMLAEGADRIRKSGIPVMGKE